MTFADAEAYLLRLPSFSAIGGAAYVPGFERIEALLAGMGDPHRALRIAHVAGTNGKGSTASMLASIGTAAGKRMGLHTSPHLYRLNERMRIDGVPIPDEQLAVLVARHAALIERVRPSFFEATVALSLLHFAEEAVDAAVVEVGLGGRLDATNIVSPAVCAITTIGLEHTAFLGDTIEAIAAEKAGIVKPGVPVVCSVEQPSAVEVVRRIAHRQAAPFHGLDDEVTIAELSAAISGITMDVTTPQRMYAGLFLALPGRFQARNAALATRVAELFFEDEMAGSGAAVYRGMRQVRRLSGLRGRLEVLAQEPLIVQDVGHNHDGLSASLAFMNEQLAGSGGRLFVVFGVMRDKDIDRMAQLLKTAEAHVVLVPISVERALPPPELADRLSRHVLSIHRSASVEDALMWFRRQATPDDGLLITGSHFVASQILPQLDPN
ncbi:MAG: folylpolyglutamate synthase/dihydrofolate synthase family protein [Rhodothermales bacterium]